MWRITATDREGREIARLEVEAGDMTIGRDADRQLILPAPSVSRRHCRLRIDGNGPVVMDEGSANGVIVNGVRITAPTAVNQTSRIEVAEFRLTVEPVAPPRSALSGIVDPASMMAMGVPQQQQMPPQMQMAGMPAGMPADVVRLIAEGGPYDGRIFDLPVLQDISVGRAVDNDVILDDPSLSRKHARLRRLGGGRLDVEDANSANGTYVNGRKITRSQLGPGDTLRFGELMFRLDGGGVVPNAGQQFVNQRATAPAGAKRNFIVLCAITVLIYGGWLYAWRVSASAPAKGAVEEAIAKRIQSAAPLVQSAQDELKKREWSKARGFAEQALDIDPANGEATRVKNLAVRAEEDQKRFQQGTNDMEKGSANSLQAALQAYYSMSPDSSYREEFAGKLSAKLTQSGRDQCRRKLFRDCASMLCDAFRVAPASAKPGPDLLKVMHDAEKRGRVTSQCILR